MRKRLNHCLLNRLVYFLFFFPCWVVFNSAPAGAEPITLYQSVEKALDYSPRLSAVSHNHKASQADLKRALNRYFPSVDLMLGYGLEQYSDSITRQPGADPADSDWDPRGEVSLRLTQKVYDGGETRQQISVQKALLDSASYRILDASQKIAMDAIIAHLEVYKQRELVIIAEEDLKFHQNIYQSLSDMAQAGVGNIADVTQTQARMARARSNLFIIKADLNIAIANYTRVVGTQPGNLAFAEVPETMSNSLVDVLMKVEQNNPDLLSFNARLMEASARVGLAHSSYKPKINIELNSRYLDQSEGDSSWQSINDAMLVLRWNLFNGGQDKEMKNAALWRKHERRSNLDDKLLELREMTSAAWTTYLSLQMQRKAYAEAKHYSQKTFDAYMKQYGVSKRSLLDVLSAKNDYFKSAIQLISVNVNEIIVAHRILMFQGEMPISKHSNLRENSIE